MFDKTIKYCVVLIHVLVLLSLFVWCLLLSSGCSSALLDKSIQQSTKIVKGFVEVHDIVQDSVGDVQQFCADMYVELEGNGRAQKSLVNFCNDADRAFDEIQRIEKQFLKDSVK